VGEIVLVRHAPTAWTGHRYCGRSDPQLDAAGRAVAARLAAEVVASLRARTLVVSSPSRRAYETAMAIAADAGIAEIAVDDRWRETDFGIAEGLTFEELERAAPELAGRLAAGETWIDWPDGEPAEDLATRVTAAWRDVVAADRDVVVVSHGGPLRIAIGLATGRQPEGGEIPQPGAFVRVPLPVAR
jgi:broad specificity phosphatase PhoE